MARPRKYPDELLDRGVRVVVESGRPIAHMARDLGVGAESLRKRVRQAEADSGRRSDLLSTQEREEIRKLRRENLWRGVAAARAVDEKSRPRRPHRYTRSSR